MRWNIAVLDPFRFRALIVLVLLGWVGGHGVAATAQDSQKESSENEAALAQYADAANFQTNGELRLAIEEWQSFLKKFPENPLAAKAAHYMGVCYMQLPEPDLAAAADAFQRALEIGKQQGGEYELREESLANLGWCQFALGTDPAMPDKESLAAAIATYGVLLKESPASKFADRAIFYSGEAKYAMGKKSEAIAEYDRLLKSKSEAESALVCDARYAKAVALEDLRQYDAAVVTFREMLEQCGDGPLAASARLHLAEILVLQGKYPDAEKIFAEIVAGGGDQKPHAIYRRAFVLAQMDRSDEAARLYETLIEEYPQSPFAASALLAAAQSHYRAGQMDEAAERFEQVLAAQSDLASATEAAHWLSVMAMQAGQVERAESVAREQIARGLEGPYKTLVRVDAAEARSMQPGKQAEALAEFEQILADSPDDPLLPRILYNAAFTALQAGQPQKALQWAEQFAARFADDPLATDMQYIKAEANLLAGNGDQAVVDYQQLLTGADDANPQVPLWVLRAATAMMAAGQHDAAIELLESRRSALTEKPQQAEAMFLIASAHLAAGRHEAAIEGFQRTIDEFPQWQRTPEAQFRLAAAQQAAGDTQAAAEVWRQMIDQYAEAPIADQARYRLAQQLADDGQMEPAIALYDELLREGGDVRLRPFALYGRGWARLQQKQYEAAIESLTAFLDENKSHPLRDDALLARGITHRRLEQEEAAASDLQALLEMQPEGENLGHALYELALIDRKAGRPQQAVARLERLLEEVPEYPALASVHYELAWALKDAGQAEEAVDAFATLANAYPESAQAAEANYYVGQQHYASKQWARAAEAYARAAELADQPELREKALYRLGWSQFHSQQFDQAAATFQQMASAVPEGKLYIDALMMIGESHFAKGDYETALAAYTRARDVILDQDGDARKFVDPAEQRVRELVFLHGGQSAGQLGQWDQALRWYDQLRERYPASAYLPQVFYETGFAHQQLGDDQQAMKFYSETAETFRDESAARARFMMGEIYFKQGKPAEAITEFKRVMYGFGAEKAPEAIQDWQAKSGFEAGRCAELLIQANEGERREQAIEVAKRYYQYVIDSHAEHPLAAKARDRLEVLDRL